MSENSQETALIVSQYLSFELRNPIYSDTPITVRMLLSHTSGISFDTDLHRDYRNGVELLEWKRSRSDQVYTFNPFPELDVFMENSLTPGREFYSHEVWTENIPGEVYGYSNIGYILLGLVIENVSGQQVEEYLSENIFQPLGMDSTGFLVDEFVDRNAPLYERIYGVLTKTNVQIPNYDQNCVGASGIKTTVRDLAKFMAAHMNSGSSNGYMLLEPETVALMHAEAVKGSGDLMMEGYGLGFTRLQEEPGQLFSQFYDMDGAIGHGGSNWGYTCHMYFVEDGAGGGYGIILMTNVRSNVKPDDHWNLVMYSRLMPVLMQEAAARYNQHIPELDL